VEGTGEDGGKCVGSWWKRRPYPPLGLLPEIEIRSPDTLRWPETTRTR